MSSGDLSRRSEEKTRESDTLWSPKDACDAQAALRGRACGAHSGGPNGLAAWRRVPGTQALVGGPAVGVLRPVGGARARGPSPPAARALACRPAAHVFLFCVVAFVLEARIYILSVSGEWAGALVPAGERRSRRPVFSIAPPPFSHHSNQVGAGNLQGPVCRVWESFFFLFFFSSLPPPQRERFKKKPKRWGSGGWGTE